MSEDKPASPLRVAAEARLSRDGPGASSPMSNHELLHELQVHQVELELQNEALRQSHLELELARDRYLDLYEFAPVGYLTLTRSGQVTEANLTAAAMLGVERKNLRRARFELAVLPADRPRWEQAFIGAKTKVAAATCDIALARGDGGPSPSVHVDIRRGSSADGEMSLLVTLTDISELKRAALATENALAELRGYQTRLELATRAAEIGIFTWDFAADRVDWDERASEILALPAGKNGFEPSYGLWRSRVHPDDLPRIEPQIAAARSRKTPYEHEYRIVLRDGRIRHLQVTVVVEADSAGEPLRHIGVVRDVTALREHECALDRARAVADAASQAKGNFLVNVSHEIRTPMNAILGAAQLLERSQLDAQQAGYVATIRASGRSMLALISDVLDFSKIEAGKLELDESPFLLANVVKGVVDIFAPTAADKGIGFVCAPLPVGLPALLGDATRLGQVLSNLVGNAIKFTARGEVTIAVTVERCDAASVRLRFAVRDTGIGIDAANIDRLFSPFTQADRSVHRTYGGTGLGLAICRELVTAMGGAIGVASEPGQGSEFWFVVPFVPLAVAPVQAPRRAPGDAAKRLRGLRLLVVDDSPVNCDIASKLLAGEGAWVESAANGQEAVARLRAGPADFDLVLMDLQMPQMDGLEATGVIRGELGLGALPVIALTAGALPSQRQRAEAAGMNGFATKPFELDELVATIHANLPPGLQASFPVPGRPSGPPPVEKATAAFPDVPGIDGEEVASRVMGRRDTFYSLLRALREESASAQQTRADLARGDRAAAVARMHKLAGIAGNASAKAVAAAARTLEAALERGDTSDAGTLLTMLERALWELLAGLPADLDDRRGGAG